MILCKSISILILPVLLQVRPSFKSFIPHTRYYMKSAALHLTNSKAVWGEMGWDGKRDI